MVKLPHLTKTEKRALQEFKRKITQKLAGQILELKLFGSKARGDYKRTSDIDIILVLKNATERNKDVVYDITVKLLLKYGLDLSVKIFSEKEFQYLNKLQTPFMLNIQKEAKIL